MNSKLFEIFRNLKSDAVPRPPRQHNKEVNEEPAQENNENLDSSNEAEEIHIELDEDVKKGDKKPKFGASFFKSRKKNNFPKEKKSVKGNSTVNTQATGNVINIVNSKNVRWGNDYYMGPTLGKKKQDEEDDDYEDHIQKCNLIKLLMEAQIKPEHKHINFVSKNLGKTWRSLFRSLGYTKGQIDTAVIDAGSYGVSEARYQLLMDWIDNKDEATLGYLAEMLWNTGERQIVKELAIMYNTKKK